MGGSSGHISVQVARILAHGLPNSQRSSQSPYVARLERVEYEGSQGVILQDDRCHQHCRRVGVAYPCSALLNRTGAADRSPIFDPRVP